MFEQQMKALKEGNNLTPAQVIQQMNVVPAEGTRKDGKGGGQGQDNPWKGAPCWFHNAKHHYPEWGHCCLSKIDEATGKTTCWYPHTIMSRKEFDALPPPRSIAKGGGKGGGPGNSPQKGGA